MLEVDSVEEAVKLQESAALIQKLGTAVDLERIAVIEQAREIIQKRLTEFYNHHLNKEAFIHIIPEHRAITDYKDMCMTINKDLEKLK